MSGSILKLDCESDDHGIYNSEYLTITNSSFSNVDGTLVDYYRGRADQSTFGPHFSLTRYEMNGIGNGKRTKSKSSLTLHGVQIVSMKNTVFSNIKLFQTCLTVGELKSRISENTVINSKVPIVVELNSGLAPTAVIKGNMGTRPSH